MGEASIDDIGIKQQVPANAQTHKNACTRTKTQSITHNATAGLHQVKLVHEATEKGAQWDKECVLKHT